MWTYEAILEKLLQLARDGRNETDPPITTETLIGDISDFDSLALVEFYMLFEDTFRVSLPEEKMRRDMSLAEIARLIHGRMK